MEGRGEVLILSSNNYLGLCDEPRSSTRASRGSTGSAPARRACASSAARSRSIASSRRRSRGSSAPRRRCRTSRRGTRTKGFTATIVEEGDFVVSRRAEPRVDHRLDPAGEGDHEVHDGGLQARRHGRPRAKLETARRARSGASSGPTACSRWKAPSRSCPTCCEIAREHDAIVAIDDSHATGVLGETGRGTAEHFGVLGEVDVITSTLARRSAARPAGSSPDRRRCATC